MGRVGRPAPGAARTLVPAVFLLAAVAAIPAGARLWNRSDFDRQALRMPENCRFVDRNGELLRFLPDARGERSLWIPGGEIPEAVKQAFIAAEDRRFHAHPGFDPLAILRAARDNRRRGRIVSGASTITQQVARLLSPQERSYEAKAIEILRAVRLERMLSKEEILEQYLNRVPLGNNLRGVELAARVYFGRGVRDLSPAEVATLAALPKAPGFLNPYGPHREALRARRDWVLSRMVECGFLPPSEAAQARGTPITVRPYAFANKARHAVDLLLARGVRGPGEHRTTIDAALQAEVERIIASQAVRLSGRNVRQAAVLVVHNPTMEVLASAGSLAHGPADAGYNNGTVARRSAGSALKPFLYALALDTGFTASTLLNDTLQVYRTPQGEYRPDNFDRNEYGPVTVRTALANSLNISAVRTLEALPGERFERFLSRARLLPARGKRPDYGLGLAIGNAEVRLEDLSAAYAMLANRGLWRPLRYMSEDRGAAPRRLLSREAAFIVSDILADPSARLVAFGATTPLDFPYPVSFKTGTSVGYRDGWIVGFTPDYTVGVWTGNFDGKSTALSTGAWAAAPILRRVMERLHDAAPPIAPTPPPGVETVSVCGLSGMKPGPNCSHRTRELFARGTAPERICTFHAENGERHRLPVEYARWLYKKHRAGAAGRYRLQRLPEGLDTLFRDGPETALFPQEEAGVRLRAAGAGEGRERNGAADPSVTDSAVAGAPSGAGRFHVGLLPEGGADLPSEADGEIAILYPLPHDRFLRGPGDPGPGIRLEALPADPVPYVDWYVDGRHLARVGPPYSARWKPERGKHRIVAATPGSRADAVAITVE